MSESVRKAEGGLARREMLKKSALVGVVAWTVPIVGSFNAPAFGQVTVSPAACTHWNCTDPVDICGTNPVPPPHDRCGCTTDTQGDAFCFNNAICDDVPGCATTADCDPGWKCITDSCCGVPKCAPPCGTFPTPTSDPLGVEGGSTLLSA